MDLASKIRDIPDFPVKGILFKDITTLLQDPAAWRESVDALVTHYEPAEIDVVVGVEARGFIFGAPLAYYLGCGFVPVRKPGRLPAETIKEEYSLEYGVNALEIHSDGIQPGQKTLVVDDLLATGGTALATCKLVERLGGEVAGVAFVIELDFLHGREKLKGYEVFSLIHFE
ncbi:MAG: adenine phosphoribosyltransferase [Anaerolineae bacterium]